MSIVIKAKDTYRWGIPTVLPFVGEQIPSEVDGTFEIENEEDAANLVLCNPGFEVAAKSEQTAGSVVAPVVETTELSGSTVPPVVDETTSPGNQEEEELKEKSESDELNEKKEAGPTNVGDQIEKLTEEELAAYKQDLSIKKLAELTQMCIDAGFPGGEWRGKKKEDLVEYLVSKMS